MSYWAHSDPEDRTPDDPENQWQKLSVHLTNVATLASQLAEATRPGDFSFREAAQLSGHLHDLGKYTDCFQNMIRTKKGKCQHSAHGAAIAFDTHNADVAFAIAGHHSGIPDRSGGTGTLDARVKEAREESKSLQQRALADLPTLGPCFQQPSTFRKIALSKFDLHTRMVFSCLVDADRLDSASRPSKSPPLLAHQRLASILTHIENIAAKTPEGAVKDARRVVLDDCLQAASYPERLLSLTVPTGGGKTLAAMAFALKRATLFPAAYRRIIVVIPYLSIIEQNATVYADIFGSEAILEHHSGSFDKLAPKDADHFAPDATQSGETSYSQTALRPATENWEAPIIVTTSVRFFESLFSNRPSDLRRVHNIAGSIIILDEVQTLPRRLLAPLLSMIRELTENWGCTFVFSTATQPAFQKPLGSPPKDPRWAPGSIREIVSEPAKLQAALKRVVIEWELDRTIPWTELATRILRECSALCVVNLRDHASALFDEVLLQAGQERAAQIFHLSTRMCAAHRLVILAEIRQRLIAKKPCFVISTQLIEAGVDLDFPIAFRALGPLDSIFQVAGRADRNGLLTEQLGKAAGKLIVFRPADERTPPNEYKEATERTSVLARSALYSGKSIQPDSIDQMDIFWNRYYGESDDTGMNLQQLRQEAKFATLAEQFEMISNRTLDVFVPYDDQSRVAIDSLRAIGVLTRELRSKLQRYVIGLLPNEIIKGNKVLEEIRKGNGIWVAVEKAYTQQKGLKFELDAADTFI